MAIKIKAYNSKMENTLNVDGLLSVKMIDNGYVEARSENGITYINMKDFAVINAFEKPKGDNADEQD